ncbi:cysteine hydrolase (plasmid) [Mesorhizobium sp. AR07]|uniref:cysteine hydrolase family protein n=1 Tax=Mesorhizobium sp. AR07 TaxID=2865838 RepID=UPI0021601AB0|nr:isochorismatase family cysteine hydrolase [Mesorhizobium sp. AR07]UVK49570.1 cysteine hydrolase [Mesorhizobium sp. AR07]
MTALSEPIGRNAVHLCIDMQRLFAESTDWHTPTLADIVPNVTRILEAKAGHTIFARFTVPDTPETAQGAWRSYYRRWLGITEAASKDPGLIDLVEPFATLARGEEILDKPTYSMFGVAELQERLAARNIDTLIITGVETDICVLATVFDAVDRGYRVIVVEDAVTSSSLESHQAVMDLLLPRVPEQIALASTATLIAGWTD